MTDEPDFDSLAPIDQLVLCAVCELDREGLTPIRTPTIRQLCRTWAVDDDSMSIASVSEADAMRALYRLESSNLLEPIRPDSTSPVGKGRPAYELAIDPETARSAIEFEPPETDLDDVVVE